MFSLRASIFLKKMSNTLKKTLNHLKHSNNKIPLYSKFAKAIPTTLLFLTASNLCDGISNKEVILEIEELSKPELVEHLNSEKK
jgi:hypothetical protein